MSGIEGRPLRVALVTSSYNFIADGVALTLNRLVGWLEAQGVTSKARQKEAHQQLVDGLLRRPARLWDEP